MLKSNHDLPVEFTALINIVRMSEPINFQWENYFSGCIECDCISQAAISMKKSKRTIITLDGMANRISALDKTSFLVSPYFWPHYCFPK